MTYPSAIRLRAGLAGISRIADSTARLSVLALNCTSGEVVSASLAPAREQTFRSPIARSVH